MSIASRTTAVRRVFAGNRRVDEDHHAVAGEVDQRRFMAGRDGANGFVVFRAARP